MRDMFGFRTEQRTFDVGGVKVGGQPGELPTVLIGTIFYHGHRVVEDEKRGLFDRRRAEGLINRQDELSDRTGNPCMVDVVGETPEALTRFVDFVAEATDAPILMDGGTAANNIAGLEHAEESGLVDRVVYNSLIPHHKPAEVEKIEEVGLDSAVLLALNMRDFTTRGRVSAIRELLPVARRAGIKKPLIDTCVMDIPTLGQACQAILQLKAEFGLPAGCGAHNAVSTWRGLRAKFGDEAVEPCTASANVVAAAVGADFILYGPIEAAPFTFP
ncbi:TPA: tetrahydromethanopterin S-methyltransferase subunit H, partial [Candidatus Bathyarchaeota archaeon]|nr:tetrahydromethanopterin S-methyltransferase subunit H [Candidatus Bathyarchaeota archaeon]